jgi:dihydroorotase
LSPLEKARHYFRLSQLQASIDIQTSTAMLRLSQETLSDELQKGSENKFIKALFLQVNQITTNSNLLLTIKKELDDINFNRA